MIHIRISFHVPYENVKKFFNGGFYTRLLETFDLLECVQNCSPFHGSVKQPDGSYHVHFNLLANNIEDWEDFNDQDEDWRILNIELLDIVGEILIECDSCGSVLPDCSLEQSFFKKK